MKRLYKVIKILEKDGWFFVRQKGSHRHYHHPVKRGTTTVDGKPSDDLDSDLLKSISRQSGIKF
ncbi:MAG: type II toxin-antitoxin system HicA family toxin [Prevotellaceae bacterium]|jgi:predicted RNA binding protein YcfA (HicA-like mRNA interferase family)|nr:type II toxin-antitoxin system HicA family toxin [Prevotellaceae bacterium]